MSDPAGSPLERYVVGLDEQQRAAVLAPSGPLCILAGAGTGKTRTITHRIAYLVGTGQFTADQILAVTFTSRAAGEMRGRLRQLGIAGVQARTFHAAALRQLAYFWPRHFDATLPELMPSKLRLVAQSLARLRISADTSLMRDVAGEVEWARSCLISPEDYSSAAAAADRDTPLPADELAKVMKQYDELKQRARVIDFEDVLMSMAYLIESVPSVAQTLRAQYRAFVVDEYQDVNPLQQRLLMAWLGDRDDLCVVGDASQTIYTFTGARPDYLLEFAQRHPGANVVHLERDYRSTPQVVALANRVIAAASGRIAKARLTLVGQRPDGPAPVLRTYDDEPAEAAAVARRCKDLIAAGTPPSEIAVLFRVNAQSEAYETALAELHVPYVLRGAERFFDRAEVREAIVYLRGAAGSVASSDDPLHDVVRQVLVDNGWNATEPPPGSAAREQWESVNALVGLAEELDSGEGRLSLTDFLDELRMRMEAADAPTIQGVTLASLHAAKGLEWDAVFIVGLHDGMLPISRARTSEQIEEERRLLYVGITRAREHLHLSWALRRSEGGRGTRKQSRFLDLFGGGERSTSPPTVRRRARIPRCEGCGQHLLPADADAGRCGSCAQSGKELFGELRAWRLSIATEEAVPPYIVFDDETLSAIAAAMPSTTAALLKVKGIGPAKAGKYGAAVLDLVAASNR